MARSGRLTWWAGLLLAVAAMAAAATTMATGRPHRATSAERVAGGGPDDEASGIQVASKTHDHGHGTQTGAAAGERNPDGDGTGGSTGEGEAPAGDDNDGLVVLDEDVPDDGSGGGATAGDDPDGLVVLDDDIPPDSESGGDGAASDEAGGLVVLDDEVPPDDDTGGDTGGPVMEEEEAAGDDGLIVLDGEVPDGSSEDGAGAPDGTHDDMAHSGADGGGPAEAASDDGHDDSPHGGDHGDGGHGDDGQSDSSSHSGSGHSGGGHGGSGGHGGHGAPSPRLLTCVLPGAPGGPRNYSRCMALPGLVPMALYWDVDEAVGTLTAAFVAQSIGWAAFGWSAATEADQMLSGDASNPNLAVVGMTTAGNDTSVGVYALRAKRSTGVQPVATGVYTNLSATRNKGGALVVGFTRPLAGSRGAPPVLLNGTPVNGIWSTGAPPSSATALDKHVVHGFGAIDFTRSDTDATPAESSDEPLCFPSSATVVSPSRGSIRMDALRVGDAVAAGVGGSVVSNVYLFTHADPAARSRFVVLATSDRRPPLVVSPGHYVHLADGRTAAARTVRVGDALVDAATGGAAPVTAVSAVVAAGLYNPQTLNGELVVNGYAVSTYTTAVDPAVAAAALAPVRALYAAGGGWLLGGTPGGGARRGWPGLVALLPSGRDSL